ncbi:hypothetical protein FB446DRAFT_847555 [Lentinula raphanica]|uniref:BTB domain-containing protein n=1 Tax=Lentinula raphanica TaxID=153919 RepID=A0AA38P0N8_9AGAR|nr:hypothetical protein FB446DRAFT_847555 [Lentinula raphanica]KAJ3834123.1 hypothetical protein F5878DRAFT_373750 [Lentinula raphanica]
MASAPTTIIVPNLPDPSESVGQQCWQYHPSFDSPAADVVLCASDDVMYRVPSYTLRTTSGFFRAMFTLPQPNSSLYRVERPRALYKESHDIFIPTHVPSDILTLFLKLISGMQIDTPLHEWGCLSTPSSSAQSKSQESSYSCFDTISRLLNLVESWDAPGPLSYLRLGLRNPELVKRDPFKVFSIASHFGWEYERNWAAQHSLMIDSMSFDSDTDIRHTLECMSSRDLLYLLKLRYKRKEEFEALLDDPDRFSIGNAEEIVCPRCYEALVDNGTWRALKEAMVIELERRPLGDSILGCNVAGMGGDCSSGGILTWPEADACFKATCRTKGCGSLNYDERTTLKLIQSCIDDLPWDV